VSEEELVLSDRQLEVVRLVAQGMSDQQIAEQLGISHRTVKAHIDAVRYKLHLKRRRDVPMELLRRGIDVFPR
jgi:LuxR family transcriptional regulator, maltose regulon positive regulatory protein